MFVRLSKRGRTCLRPPNHAPILSSFQSGIRTLLASEKKWCAGVLHLNGSACLFGRLLSEDVRFAMFIFRLPPCTHHPLQQLPCSFTVHREMWHPRIYTSPSTSCWSLVTFRALLLGWALGQSGPTHPPSPRSTEARAHCLKHPAGVTAICSSSARPCSLLNGSNPPGNVQVEQP